MKKVSLDYKKCARCGLCANICPGVFGWSSKTSEPTLKKSGKKDKEVATAETDDSCIEEAARFCPTGAIIIAGSKGKK
ncbi:MAG: ferredoxin [Patescibacteria group bacterium]|nr:ferredoxin [Patescibacteria group bacterium]MCL5261996.1 ferredoxin [Patescibacteria group bacterium]